MFYIVSLFFIAATLTACLGDGDGGDDGGTAAPNNVPRYAFVANAWDGSVSSYVVDAANGRLKYIGKAAAGSSPISVTVDPSGKYAYVANSVSANVSQYTIGADGRLTAMATATVAAGTNPISVTTTGGWQ